MGNFSYSRVEDIFRNVSESMTAYMRSAGAKGVSDPATGVVLRYAVCLHMEWAWLTLPAVLVLLMLLFFVFILITTKEQPVWKDSPHCPGSTTSHLFRESTSPLRPLLLCTSDHKTRHTSHPAYRSSCSQSHSDAAASTAGGTDRFCSSPVLRLQRLGDE